MVFQPEGVRIKSVWFGLAMDLLMYDIGYDKIKCWAIGGLKMW